MPKLNQVMLITIVAKDPVSFAVFLQE